MLIWKKLVLDFDFGVSTKSAKIGKNIHEIKQLKDEEDRWILR
jgi:hypothetical protein